MSCQVIYSQFGLAIHQNDHQARRRFVEWAQNEIVVVPDFHKRILFSDEAHFWLNGYVNKQNCRIWSEANPQVYVETPLHSEKLTVWCALWAGGITGPYFFKNDEGHNVTVNGDRYRAMITNFFMPELNNHDVQELWFQQDGATCHTARATIDLLKYTFGDRLISRFGPVNWPPRSCDLTPIDYFLWGYVKSLVYADKPQTLDHLEDNIRRVIADIRPQMLEKVIENWTSRLDYIRASRGSPMPEIIFKILLGKKYETFYSMMKESNKKLREASLATDITDGRCLKKLLNVMAMFGFCLVHSVVSYRVLKIEVNTTSPSEIQGFIKNLKPNKSPGIDLIINRILKNLPTKFTIFIALLFNMLLENCYFTKSSRVAVVIPILKPKSDDSNPQNYSPISLLSSLSKAYEFVILSRLNQHCLARNIIIPEQHGVVTKCSTVTQLLRVTELVYTGFQNHQAPGILFVDIAKAFDKFWHHGLIPKMMRLGFSDQILKIIRESLELESKTVSPAFVQEKVEFLKEVCLNQDFLTYILTTFRRLTMSI
ncbi:probable RNA-directed DNA polymerase from transposon BS [Trichonephila clavipes]|nr:probable RNA-directed DNA polymerase from transposon BS [Trichonephila clavipes]